MSIHQNSYDTAELLTAYVDGELQNEEKQRLAKLISSDKKAQIYINQHKELKATVRRACSSTTAPQHLRQRCLDAISAEINPPAESAKPVTPKFYLLFAAAAVIILSVTTFLRLQPADVIQNTAVIASFPVEDHVYRHFNNSNPELHTSFTYAQAQEFILEAWDLDITVPSLEGAAFAGFAYTEFVPGFHTPVLVYNVEGEAEPILIFAFDVPHMSGEITLLRDEEAVSTCIDHDSVHIKDVSGKHVVSWMWGDTWYAGISSHHGEVLASRLPINR